MALIINKIKLIYITTNKFLRGTQISNDTDIYVIAYQSILSSSKFLFSQPVTWFKHSSFSSPCASRTCRQANGNCCETLLCGCCLLCCGCGGGSCGCGCGGSCSCGGSCGCGGSCCGCSCSGCRGCSGSSCGRSCCCCCSCLSRSRSFNSRRERVRIEGASNRVHFKCGCQLEGATSPNSASCAGCEGGRSSGRGCCSCASCGCG